MAEKNLRYTRVFETFDYHNEDNALDEAYKCISKLSPGDGLLVQDLPHRAQKFNTSGRLLQDARRAKLGKTLRFLACNVAGVHQNADSGTEVNGAEEGLRSGFSGHPEVE